MERALFVFIVVLAALTLGRPRTWRGYALAGAIVAAAGLAGGVWNAYGDLRRAAATALAANVPQATRDGYTSSDACRACHPAAYASWHQSYHRTMTQPASAASIQAAFDGGTLRMRGHAYRFMRSGEAFVVDIDGVTRQVALITGSHHQQRLWLRSDARWRA